MGDSATSDVLDNINKTPRTVGELRSLLGFLGYFHSLIKDFARVLKPLYDLISNFKCVESESQSNSSKEMMGQKSSKEIII